MKKKMHKLRKETITSEWMNKLVKKKHVHEYGEDVHDEETDMWSRTCKHTACDHTVEFEKM